MSHFVKTKNQSENDEELTQIFSVAFKIIHLSTKSLTHLSDKRAQHITTVIIVDEGSNPQASLINSTYNRATRKIITNA